MVESSVQMEAGEAAGNRERVRVLILGCAPLPFENQKMNLAPGFRTWQFASVLARDGHDVEVVAMRIPGAYESVTQPMSSFDHEGVSVTTMDDGAFRRPGAADEVVGAFDPEVVIGASSSAPALRAVELADARPLWIDLFGDLMAEGQARLGFDPDADLFPYRDALLCLLARGDAFSVVSDRQRWATVGQLGLVGRLNEANRGFPLVYTVPCSVDAAGLETPDPSLSGSVTEFTEQDVVVLWGGGFNTWCDPDVLFEGMELAMARDARLRLAVTGGAIGGHDDVSYPRFLERVAGSRFVERFAIKGRLPADEADAYLRRADIGIVTEKDIAERWLGSSGRVLHWLSRGLPLVCTELSEVGSILGEKELAATYREGDPEDLARAVLELSRSDDLGRERARRAREYAVAHWSPEITMAPVRDWVAKRRRAPDAGLPNPVLPDLSESQAELAAIRSELNGIHHSRMWRLWTVYSGIKQRLGLGPKKAETNRD